MNNAHQREALRLLKLTRDLFDMPTDPETFTHDLTNSAMPALRQLLAGIEHDASIRDESATLKPQAIGSAEPWDTSVANLKTLNARDNVRYADLLSDGRYKVIDDTGAQITASYEQVCDWLDKQNGDAPGRPTCDLSAALWAEMDEELARPTFERPECVPVPAPVRYEYEFVGVQYGDATRVANELSDEGWELFVITADPKQYNMLMAFRRPKTGS